MPHSNITLTIAIPTYNRANLLAACLDQLLLLKVDAWDVEVLVLDNDSNDRTAKLVEGKSQELSSVFNFRYIRRVQNLGAVPNLLRGLEEARGKYFLFIGDDDRLLSESFPKLMGVLRRNVEFAFAVESDRPLPDCASTLKFDSEAIFRQSEFFSLRSPIYKFGNAWAGIFNTRLARATLAESPILRWAESNAWAQLALIAIIARKTELEGILLGFQYGEQFQQRPFTFGGMTAIKSLSDLVAVAVNVSEYLNHDQPSPLIKQLTSGHPSPVSRHLRSLLTSWPGRVALESPLWKKFVSSLASGKAPLTLRFYVCLVFSSNLASFSTFLSGIVRRKTNEGRLVVHY